MSQLSSNPNPSFAREGFLMAMIALLGLGTMMVFSSTGATRTLEPRTDFLVKHVVFLGISALLFVVVLRFPASWLWKLAPLLFLAGTVLLLLVLVPGIGQKINGARRWFRFGPISFQPSEFMKILLPLMLAWLSRKAEARKWAWPNLLGFLLLMLVPLLIAIEPDLGTSALVFAIGICFLFLAGFPWKIFLAGCAGMVPLLAGLMHYRPYQWERITAYVSALGNWENAQYQVKQSLLSIGSGGIQGTGLGRGLQKLSFLPESHTDFVFAVIGEELGLIGMLMTMALWCLLFACGLRLLQDISENREQFALAGTLLTGIVFQAAINICVVTSLVPPKGISHPLLSYGGSNLLATMLALALFLNLTNSRTREIGDSRNFDSSRQS